jgi:hypothetical protein
MAVQEGEIHRYTSGMGFIAGLSSWAGSGLGLAKPGTFAPVLGSF